MKNLPRMTRTPFACIGALIASDLDRVRELFPPFLEVLARQEPVVHPAFARR